MFPAEDEGLSVQEFTQLLRINKTRDGYQVVELKRSQVIRMGENNVASSLIPSE